MYLIHTCKLNRSIWHFFICKFNFPFWHCSFFEKEKKNQQRHGITFLPQSLPCFHLLSWVGETNTSGSCDWAVCTCPVFCSLLPNLWLYIVACCPSLHLLFSFKSNPLRFCCLLLSLTCVYNLEFFLVYFFVKLWLWLWLLILRLQTSVIRCRYLYKKNGGWGGF